MGSIARVGVHKVYLMVPLQGLGFMKYILGSIARVGVPGVYLMVPLLGLGFQEYIRWFYC